MTVAFVLAGGGSLGAVQVGMLRALMERGVRPDFIVGTSAGALNGVFLAARSSPDGVEELAQLWHSLRRSDVFPLGPLQGALGYYGARNWLVRPDPLKRLVRAHLRFERLEEAPIPLHVLATEIVSGEEVLISRGDALSAVLASASIPGVFPPVKFGARELVDGGVSNNAPLSHALALGAHTVYVLPAGYACALSKPPSSALAMALQALTILIGRGLALDIERYDGHYALHVVPPLCPLDVIPTNFTRAAELIERAYLSTCEWLDLPAEDAAPLRQVHGIRPHAH